jgi:hypothetical protein
MVLFLLSLSGKIGNDAYITHTGYTKEEIIENTSAK